jgi:hypothetical protein
MYLQSDSCSLALTMVQFGSLITYGLGHINSSVFEPYQVINSQFCIESKVAKSIPSQIIFLFFGLITVGMSAAIL